VPHIAGTRNDGELRKTRPGQVDQSEAVGHVVDRHDQQLRARRACRRQQIEARRVTIEDLVAELAQGIDLVRVVVKHRDRDALREQQAADYLAVTPHAGDDHRRTVVVDRVRCALRACAASRQAIESDQQQRRGGHRQRHGRSQQAFPVARQDLRRTRDAEDDEGELAGLREQRREQPAFGTRNLEARRDQRQHRPLDHQQTDDQHRQQGGPRDHLAEVDRHAHGDEEQSEQQPLERRDVAFQGVPVFRAGQQHAGQKRSQRHRQAGTGHQLGDADHQQ